ncbi:DUF6143 family protein [Acetivibrio cellulolyticus]|uniref:DUF6143 family protein n=1 Tax=Acetivibrio cellulolyticus TaxID=35830 RepID=UPI0001E2D4A4|nr:DUF6143 family protein [Acetivibrio cellulolyticus]
MKFAFVKKEKQPKEVVVLSDAVYHSYLGEYFLGQTDIITFGDTNNGWGALVNPANSNVNMFLNAYTISNFASIPLTAEGWLSSMLPGNAKVSTYFAPGNQSIVPSPVPHVKIKNASMVSGTPTGGTYTFVRRVEPNATLTKHDFQGMYIIPPGSSFALFFLSPGKGQVHTRVAFGWWEEKICR